MGWKGTIRAVGAASRRADRASQQRQRELQRREKEYSKMEALEQAAYEIEVYKNRLDLLVSVHKEFGAPLDWVDIAAKEAPVKPIITSTFEQLARAKETAYKPNFFVKTLKLEGGARKKLSALTLEAVQRDLEQNLKVEALWTEEHKDWAEEQVLAEGVLRGDPKAKMHAIKMMNPFTDISDLGSELSFSVGEVGVLECKLSVHGSTAIPSEVKSLLQSGKLSVKKMPIGKFNELLQDYVCSCLLRVASELLSLLPDDLVIVTAVDSMLNTASGHLEDQAILSVAISRSTLAKLNMNSIDPSDAMGNFVHNMSFKKTQGFAPVESLDPARFASRVVEA